MTVQEIARKIEQLKIQGATSVAIEAVKALKNLYEREKDEEALEKAGERLKNTRPTEPALKNAVNYCIRTKKFDKILGHFKSSKKEIAETAQDLLKDGTTVYTHCHSSTVTEILKLADSKEKEIDVKNTETRPVFQGRTTARELAELDMRVEHFVDSAARFALKKSDVMLIGADAVTFDGHVYNKVGSELIANVANDLEVPLYVCTDSLKLAPETGKGLKVEIEERLPSEVWENAPEGVEVRNPAFEKVKPRFIEGIVTELGILGAEKLSERAVEEYPEIFSYN
ncbi:MAG: hypothetical protein SVV03_03365 [Candidatus Nanohaloarchaea archaeon]|nr:hypothetical protein [Candidatus Nanohaloarchaea archaeon]